MSALGSNHAFRSLELSINLKRYCSMLQYFGSALYLYYRMPMGLNISHDIWKFYINGILIFLQGRKYFEAIINYMLLFTPTKKSHMAEMEDLLKALIKYGLNISPRKCQLSRKELQYMGNTIYIRVCVKH